MRMIYATFEHTIEIDKAIEFYATFKKGATFEVDGVSFTVVDIQLMSWGKKYYLLHVKGRTVH